MPTESGEGASAVSSDSSCIFKRITREIIDSGAMNPAQWLEFRDEFDAEDFPWSPRAELMREAITCFLWAAMWAQLGDDDRAAIETANGDSRLAACHDG